MAQNYTKVHYDFNSLHGLKSPRRELELKAVALGLIKLSPEEGYSFTHHHDKQEEVYTVVEGTGSMLLDGELIAVQAGDILRVSPECQRALKAGTEGLFIICSGAVAAGYPKNPNARYLIDDGKPDYDDIPPWYQGDPAIKKKNQALKERLLAAKTKRSST